MPPYSLEQLDTKQHDRKRFTCGQEDLDNFLHHTARQSRDAGTATCFVLTDPGDPSRIVGYFTLTQHAIDPGPGNRALFEKRPRVPCKLPVPVTLLGRLAVDEDFQRQGVGEILVATAVERALAVSYVVASRAVVVDPIDANARSFYERYGFELLNSETGRLFMSMHTVAAHFAPAESGAAEVVNSGTTNDK